MRRSLIFLGIVLLALFVAMPAVAGDRSSGQGTTYQVEHQHHIQTLGGESECAQRGLVIAARRSKRIAAVDPEKDPADDPVLEPIIEK